MKTQHSIAFEPGAIAAGAECYIGNDCCARAPGQRTILLITKDIRLHESLRCLANTIGRIVVRLSESTGVASILHALKPRAVLLDLDLPKQAAWKVAETLFSQPTSPSVILFTAPKEQFDLKTAIRAGLLVDKSEGPSHLLEATEEVLAMPDSAQAERNAVQRVLIRWLKPRNWPLHLAPAYRFWGINE